MKALIIENEFDIPGEIKGFIKDSKLFTEVNEQTACIHRGLDDLGRFIPDVDAIIVMSTFMYTDQLEDYVTALASGKLGKKKYFIHNFKYSCYDWFTDKKGYLFNNFELFKQNLIKLITEQEVFTWEEDYETKERIKDNYWWGCSSMFNNPDQIKERKPYAATQLLWDENEQFFYTKQQTVKQIKEYYGS